MDDGQSTTRAKDRDSARMETSSSRMEELDGWRMFPDVLLTSTYQYVCCAFRSHEFHLTEKASMVQLLAQHFYHISMFGYACGCGLAKIMFTSLVSCMCVRSQNIERGCQVKGFFKLGAISARSRDLCPRGYP